MLFKKKEEKIKYETKLIYIHDKENNIKTPALLEAMKTFIIDIIDNKNNCFNHQKRDEEYNKIINNLLSEFENETYTTYKTAEIALKEITVEIENKLKGSKD